MGYDYRSNFDTDGELTWALIKKYHLIDKLYRRQYFMYKNHRLWGLLLWKLKN